MKQDDGVRGGSRPARPRWPDVWLARALEKQGRLAPADVAALEAESAAGGARPLRFREAVLRSGLLTEPELLEVMSERLRVEVLRLDPDALDPGLAELLPAELSRRYGVVPVGEEEGRVVLAALDPVSGDVEEVVRFTSARRVSWRLAGAGLIEAAQRRLYPVEPVSDVLARLVGGIGEGDGMVVGDPLVEEGAAGAGIAQLVDGLVAEAVRSRASDVHLEPSGQALRVRYRIDGVLREVATLPARVATPLISRLKVMASLDISDRRRPQDGRTQVRVDSRLIDARVSTLPVSGHREKAVLRLLDTHATVPALPELGFEEDELRVLRDLLRGSEGILLVTGPTGSGKTTTLYAILNEIQREGISIVTVEDPIEYRLPGASQVQVNPKASLTFASALRSILRQDPDVVLVGEIRDAETGDIAFKASNTGHQVFSTLHTNDAASTIARLLDIGMDAAAVSTALRGVVSQRLIRRVCTDCREPIAPDQLPAQQRALLADVPVQQLYRSRGCPRCDHTGYRGRAVIAEVVRLTPDIARAIMRGAGTSELEELCEAAGMSSLWEAGLRRVARGVTTLHELLDTIAVPPAAQARADEQAAAASVATGEAMSQSDIDALVQSMLAGGGAGDAPVDSADGVTTAGAATADTGRAEDVTAAAGSRSSAPPAGVERRGADAAPAAGTARGERPRVLIVDEDYESRRLLRLALEHAGFRVIEVADGQSAVDMLSRLRPQHVLLELALPRLDGFEILRRMQRGEIHAVPTVVLTRQDEPELEEWARELGAVDFIGKPIEPRLVAARLRAGAEAAA